MKTSIVISAALLFAVVSCGKRSYHQKLPDMSLMKLPAMPIEKQTLPDDFKLDKCYESENLALTFPSENNRGQVIIRGEDAKMIFEHLKIKADSRQNKIGLNIFCSQTLCSLSIDYKTLAINELSQQGTRKDNSIADLIQDYTSPRLQMNASKKRAKIFLAGNDAKALYLASDLKPSKIVVDGIQFERKSNKVDCRKNTQTNEYTCHINLKSESGVIESPKK